jgi:GT2 family glycosyltransferase
VSIGDHRPAPAQHLSARAVDPAASIGVVAIGRNEGARLRRCLESLAGLAEAVVYVDSGSSDGSADLARSLGADVINLDLSVAFSAARARNEGFARLLAKMPALELVQFVDGDCEIVAGWMETASRALRDGEGEKLAVVCGRRRERHPEASVYNTLVDIEWNTPVGIAKACGGDAMFRADAFREAGGYNPSIIAGEEPELCLRLRRRGWIIRRLDAEMTLHDADMTRFRQWWKRAERAGHAYAEAYAMHGRPSRGRRAPAGDRSDLPATDEHRQDAPASGSRCCTPPERFRAREVRSIWLWGLLLPIAIIGFALGGMVWPITLAGLILVLLYPLMALRIAARRRDLPRRAALAYGTFIMLGKLPQMLGMMRYHLNRLTGRRNQLIEYKRPPAGARP